MIIKLLRVMTPNSREDSVKNIKRNAQEERFSILKLGRTRISKKENLFLETKPSVM